jgi:hypothetical protein
MKGWDSAGIWIAAASGTIGAEIWKANGGWTLANWLLLGVVPVLGAVGLFLRRYEIVLKSGHGSFRERYEMRRRSGAGD